MITQRVWFAMIPAAMLVAGSTACISKTMAARTHCGDHCADAGHWGSTPSVTESLPKRTAQPQVDVYGNEIEDALTDYRFDKGGIVYERHSPDTEVPHLGPPTL